MCIFWVVVHISVLERPSIDAGSNVTTRSQNPASALATYSSNALTLYLPITYIYCLALQYRVCIQVHHIYTKCLEK